MQPRPTSYLQETAIATATAVGLDPHYVAWEYVPPLNGEGLVLTLPWSRVVVARNCSGAERFIEDYRQGHCSWIMDSVAQEYPLQMTPVLPPERLLEIPLTDKALVGFVRWAIRARRRSSWPVTPKIRVVGSWTTYRDGILLRYLDGKCSIRMRPPHKRMGRVDPTSPPS